MVQLSHPYMTTEKIIALTRQTFVGKVMSLLFNMLSRLVITFLPKSKRLLISWLQSSSAVILETKKIKSLTVSTVSPSICHEISWLTDHHLVLDRPHFWNYFLFTQIAKLIRTRCKLKYIGSKWDHERFWRKSEAKN